MVGSQRLRAIWPSRNTVSYRRADKSINAQTDANIIPSRAASYCLIQFTCFSELGACPCQLFGGVREKSLGKVLKSTILHRWHCSPGEIRPICSSASRYIAEILDRTPAAVHLMMHSNVLPVISLRRTLGERSRTGRCAAEIWTATST